MRTAALIAGTAAAVALAATALRGPAAPAYDGPVAVRANAVAPSPVAPEPDWAAVVGDLDDARTAGFADPAGADPLDWSDPACACLDADRRVLAALAAAGHAVDARPPRIASVVAAPAGSTVVVTVSDEIDAYTVVDGSGRAVRRWPARGVTHWRGVLVRSGGGWRWRSVSRVEDHDPARGVDPRTSG